MKRVFEKNELIISILLIVIYIVSNLFCINTFDIKGVFINGGLSLLIILFIVFNKLGDYFNLKSFPKPKEFLYFVPLFILMSVNLCGGINNNLSIEQISCHMGMMLFVGFLEEIIFRGFLFKMMAKDSLKSAIIVTSLTFGIGHIINLLNGAELVPTILQIIYATATGYLFAIIVVKGKSLWPCIVTHSIVNALSVFAANNIFTSIVSPIILTIIPIAYAIYLNKRIN